MGQIIILQKNFKSVAFFAGESCVAYSCSNTDYLHFYYSDPKFVSDSLYSITDSSTILYLILFDLFESPGKHTDLSWQFMNNTVSCTVYNATDIGNGIQFTL